MTSNQIPIQEFIRDLQQYRDKSISKDVYANVMNSLGIKKGDYTYLFKDLTELSKFTKKQFKKKFFNHEQKKYIFDCIYVNVCYQTRLDSYDFDIFYHEPDSDCGDGYGPSSNSLLELFSDEIDTDCFGEIIQQNDGIVYGRDIFTLFTGECLLHLKKYGVKFMYKKYGEHADGTEKISYIEITDSFKLPPSLGYDS